MIDVGGPGAIRRPPLFHGQNTRRVATNTTAIFYRDRARQAQTDADSATLDNVRDRWTRAAKAWDEMATRAEKTADRRAVNEEAKALPGEDED
ncbi:hypothetical protein ACFOKI_07335 [Sphingomonas qilianensis]|uniref:hypothetical protein n=1 Tax=Sphingomonas qilianensis TaxID=1736690 RepID=UPI0031F50AF1